MSFFLYTASFLIATVNSFMFVQILYSLYSQYYCNVAFHQISFSVALYSGPFILQEYVHWYFFSTHYTDLVSVQGTNEAR